MSISRESFEIWLSSQSLSENYRKDIKRKIADFLGRSIYSVRDCYRKLRTHLQGKGLDKYSVLAFRLLLRYLELNGLPELQGAELRKHLRNHKSNPDMFVPTDIQILGTLSRLSDKNRILFAIYLCSGLRKTEGEYLYRNLPALKVQEGEGFVKISLGMYRKTKTAYFCYLPSWLYELLKQNASTLSVRSLDNIQSRDKLIAIKYARKWFFTKCIELGVPESIADFYEGRASTSIGTTHYLAKQSLADKHYRSLVLPALNSMLYEPNIVYTHRNIHR